MEDIQNLFKETIAEFTTSLKTLEKVGTNMAVSKAKQIIKQLKNNEITVLEVPDEFKHNVLSYWNEAPEQPLPLLGPTE